MTSLLYSISPSSCSWSSFPPHPSANSSPYSILSICAFACDLHPLYPLFGSPPAFLFLCSLWFSLRYDCFIPFWLRDVVFKKNNSYVLMPCRRPADGASVVQDQLHFFFTSFHWAPFIIIGSHITSDSTDTPISSTHSPNDPAYHLTASCDRSLVSGHNFSRLCSPRVISITFSSDEHSFLFCASSVKSGGFEQKWIPFSEKNTAYSVHSQLRSLPPTGCAGHAILLPFCGPRYRPTGQLIGERCCCLKLCADIVWNLQTVQPDYGLSHNSKSVCCPHSVKVM